MMKKRLFSILTALALCLTMLPAAVLAAEPADGDDVSGGLDLSGGLPAAPATYTAGETGIITFEPATESAPAKLTLTGAVINNPAGPAIDLGDSSLTIVLVGEDNALTGTPGIRSTGELTFTGEGEVTINGSVTNTAGKTAMKVDGATVTVNGDVTVEGGDITTSDATGPIAAVYATNSAQVTVKKTVKISASGTITGGETNPVAGVYVSDGANVTTGSITITAGGTAAGTNGVYSFGNDNEDTEVTVNGDIRVTAEAFVSTVDSKGIFACGYTSNFGDKTKKAGTVRVDGCVTLTETNPGAYTDTGKSDGVHAEKGVAYITVTGNVTASGQGVVAGGGESDKHATGSQVTVNGSVTSGAIGVKSSSSSVVKVGGNITSSSSYTVSIEMCGTVNVGGNVSGEIGIEIRKHGKITVDGNVEGKRTGLYIEIWMEPSSGAITIKGSVSGGTYDIWFDDDETSAENLPKTLQIGSYDRKKVGNYLDVPLDELLQAIKKYEKPQTSSSSSAPKYSITVSEMEHGTVAAKPERARKNRTVTITVTPDSGYVLETLYVLDRNGQAVEVTDNGDGTYSFKMPGGKVEVKAVFAEDNSMLNFFADVFPGDYYYDAVLWAAKKGITGGVDEVSFGPHQSCTRAQVVTFLWRAAQALGLDVSVGEDTNILSYRDALDIPEYAVPAFQWAVGAGVAAGDGSSLNPGSTCTRAEIVTFLYRLAQAAGMDVSVGEDTDILSYNDALDVPEYAGPAFQWAVGAGVVQGSGGGLDPVAPCTRAQIMTMLWQLLSK